MKTRTEAGWRKSSPPPVPAGEPSLADIEHLDFPTPSLEDGVKEESKDKLEKDKRCMLLRSHPADPELQACKRKAVVLAYIVYDCGKHKVDAYLCKGCWAEVENKPVHLVTLQCKPCGGAWPFRPMIQKWERV